MSRKRIEELCAAVENGSARQENVKELAGLARDVCDEIETAHILLDTYKVVSTHGRKRLDVGDRIERMCANL